MVSPLSRRARERGAAVLIVMLAVTMLTAVGVFAAHRSAMVTSASGYDRQANQTRYLTEYAGAVTASELGEGRGGEYVRLAMDPSSSEDCDAHARSTRASDMTGRLPCYVLESADIAARVDKQGLHSGTLLEPATPDTPGSLSGPASSGSSLEGVMRVELFDARALLHLAGMDERGDSPFRPVEVIISSWAQVRTASSDESETNNVWANSPGLAGHASVQALRAHLHVPNVSLTITRNVPAAP